MGNGWAQATAPENWLISANPRTASVRRTLMWALPPLQAYAWSPGKSDHHQVRRACIDMCSVGFSRYLTLSSASCQDGGEPARILVLLSAAVDLVGLRAIAQVLQVRTRRTRRTCRTCRTCSVPFVV